MQPSCVRPVYSRREFLKLSSLGFFSLAASPLLTDDFPPGAEQPLRRGRARVAASAIYCYREPGFQSERLGILRRDELVSITGEILSPSGPQHNRLWFEITDGFVHSGYLQRIDAAHLYLHPLKSVPKGGWLGEITVPFSDSLRWTASHGWQRLYRLYYQSVYWITDLVEGADGQTWYQLTDDLLHVKFCIPTTHMRPLKVEELCPISVQVPAEQKRIEIDLARQTLDAYEAGEPVLHTRISSGLPTKGESPNGIPTDTPTGRFYIQTKMPSRHMGNGRLTNDLDAYELPGVPWVCFFHKDGLALHGTYWHSNFGRRMSHGCINLPNPAAQWLYRWTVPIAGPQDWYRRERGTVLDIY